MDHATARNFPQHAERIIVGLARMDDDGQVSAPRLFELGGEKVQLRRARLGRLVVVETNLAPRGQRRVVWNRRTIGRYLVAIVAQGANNLGTVPRSDLGTCDLMGTVPQMCGGVRGRGGCGGV